MPSPSSRSSSTPSSSGPKIAVVPATSSRTMFTSSYIGSLGFWTDHKLVLCTKTWIDLTELNNWARISIKSCLERFLQICELAADHGHPPSGQKGESSDHHWLENYHLQVTEHYDPLCQTYRRIIELIEQKRAVVKCRCAGLGKKVVPRLRECCRQSQAEITSKSINKSHQTWGTPFSRALYT